MIATGSRGHKAETPGINAWFWLNHVNENIHRGIMFNAHVVLNTSFNQHSTSWQAIVVWFWHGNVSWNGP